MTIPSLDIDPFAEDFLADPYAAHPTLRDTAPVVWLEPLQCHAMARFAEVQPALKDWETFVSGRGVGVSDFAKEEPWRPPSLLLETDPPMHQATRGLMNKVASLSSIKSHFPIWQEKAETLVDQLLQKREIEAVAEMAEAFPLSVFPDLIGLPEDGALNMIKYGSTAFDAFGPDNRLRQEALAKAAEPMKWVNEYSLRKNLRPGGWGMSVYEAADDSEFSQDDAHRLVRSFLTAGVDTTVNGIANLMHAFTLFPQEWQKLRAEPKLAKKAIEESLRFDGTVQTFFRTTSRDVEVEGGMIPEGSKVLLFLASANRDPRKWDNPEVFDINRNAGGHVAFGFGIHQCLGQMVARMELEALLSAMIPRVAEIRASAPAQRRLNNTLHAMDRLPLELVPA